MLKNFKLKTWMPLENKKFITPIIGKFNFGLARLLLLGLITLLFTGLFSERITAQAADYTQEPNVVVVVKDNKNSPVEGVNVLLKNDTIETTEYSGVGGRTNFYNIEPGTYEITAKHNGQQINLSAVVIDPRSNITASEEDISKIDETNLEEVPSFVLEGSLNNNPQTFTIVFKQNSFLNATNVGISTIALILLATVFVSLRRQKSSNVIIKLRKILLLDKIKTQKIKFKHDNLQTKTAKVFGILLVGVIGVITLMPSLAATSFPAMRTVAKSYASTAQVVPYAIDTGSCAGRYNLHTKYIELLKMARKWAATPAGTTKDGYYSTIATNAQNLRTTCFRAGFSASTWWYENEILTPMYLTETVLVMGQSFPNASTYANDSYTWASTRFNSHSSANLMSISRPMLNAAIILEDSAKMATLFSGPQAILPRLLATSKSNGFTQDGSYDFHNVMQTDYGVVLLNELTEAIDIVGGSANQPSAAQYNQLFSLIFDAFEPVMHDNQMYELSRGRAITVKTGAVAANAFFTYVARLRSVAEEPHKSRLDGWLTEVGRLSGSGISARGPLIAYKQYSETDKAAWHRSTYSVGLSLNSSEKSPYESQDDQNMKGWFTSEGRVELYDDFDTTQYDSNNYATIDHRRLPGTTSINRPDLPLLRCDPVKNFNQVYVGGVQLKGLYGLSGYNQIIEQIGEGDRDPNNPAYRPTCASKSSRRIIDTDIRSKKSYFFFDDEVVALGTNVSSTDTGGPIETTVENRLLSGAGNNALTVNGAAKPTSLGWSETMNNVSWAHLASNNGSDIGYYFPTPQTINATREQRSGAWTDITNEPPSTGIKTNKYVTLWFDHGVTPTNKSYSYVLLPGKTSNQVKSYATSPGITIIKQDSIAHSVSDASSGVESAMFWQAGSAGSIAVNKAVTVATQHANDVFTISVADPDHVNGNNGTVRVTVSKDVGNLISKDPRVTVISTSPSLILDVNVSAGKGASEPRGRSWEASFKKLGGVNDPLVATYSIGGNTPSSADTTIPSVALTSPSEGEILSGQVTFSADASDNTAVSKVEFYADGRLFATDITAPYSFNFDTSLSPFNNGAMNITATAYDDANNSNNSSINVTIDNGIISSGNATNIAINPGFENDPSTSYPSVANNGAVVTWASDQKHSAQRSLKIVGVSANTDLNQRWVGNITDIPSTSGKVYTASVWVKTENADGAKLRINGWNSSNGYVSGSVIDSTVVSGTNTEWQKISLTTQPMPNGVVSIRPEFQLQGAGTAWFDDLAICEGTQPCANDGTGIVGVNDTTPPQASPVNTPTTPQMSDIIPIRINASDDKGIDRVDFIINGTTKSIVKTPPYNFDFDTTKPSTPNGNYVVSVNVYDTSGNMSSIKDFVLKVRRSDIDRSGKVDIGDLTLVISSWNQNNTNLATNPAYDLDDDGVIGIGDLTYLISKWGNN